ncbi:MAG: DNA topoisomerase I [Acidobacteria bacterium]|nr:MAG: DNA topoisomerase I [Acidobacteriota bacterium]
MPTAIDQSEKLDTGLTVAVLVDPVESARAAGLRYVTDDEPGIRRKKRGKGFTYVDPQGRTVKDEKTLERIRKLAIPPAWTDVWICSRPNGHLQATGRDARGRKQYRYHAEWREVRDETKFGRMIAFGEALPKLHERLEQDMSQRGLGREKVLATVVKLLETTLIRVGNKEYVKQNNSFGLTTLRDRHVDVDGSTLRFELRGKSGKEHAVEVQDRRLARIVKQCRDLPGQKLFQYLDENKERQSVSSEDVNAYLRETTGEDFTAKDFRTWGGTVLALSALLEVGACESEREASKAVVEAVKRVAGQLGNRPAICRKYYVHPVVIQSFLEGTLRDTLEETVEGEEDDGSNGLRRLEAQVLRLLKGRNGG